MIPTPLPTLQHRRHDDDAHIDFDNCDKQAKPPIGTDSILASVEGVVFILSVIAFFLHRRDSGGSWNKATTFHLWHSAFAANEVLTSVLRLAICQECLRGSGCLTNKRGVWGGPTQMIFFFLFMFALNLFWRMWSMFAAYWDQVHSSWELKFAVRAKLSVIRFGVAVLAAIYSVVWYIVWMCRYSCDADEETVIYDYFVYFRTIIMTLLFFDALRLSVTFAGFAVSLDHRESGGLSRGSRGSIHTHSSITLWTRLTRGGFQSFCMLIVSLGGLYYAYDDPAIYLTTWLLGRDADDCSDSPYAEYNWGLVAGYVVPSICCLGLTWRRHYLILSDSAMENLYTALQENGSPANTLTDSLLSGDLANGTVGRICGLENFSEASQSELGQNSEYKSMLQGECTTDLVTSNGISTRQVVEGLESLLVEEVLTPSPYNNDVVRYFASRIVYPAASKASAIYARNAQELLKNVQAMLREDQDAQARETFADLQNKAECLRQKWANWVQSIDATISLCVDLDANSGMPGAKVRPFKPSKMKKSAPLALFPTNLQHHVTCVKESTPRLGWALGQGINVSGIT